MIILSLSLYSQKSQTKDSVFFEKYGNSIYSSVNKCIVTSMIVEYLSSKKLEDIDRFSGLFRDRSFPLPDTGYSNKIDFRLQNDLYYPNGNYILINYKFRFRQNDIHPKWKFFHDSSYKYFSTTSSGSSRYKEIILYENGLILYDTIKDQMRFICGTNLMDKIENEYFDMDTTQAGFINFIKIKYYNYFPNIENIDFDELFCIFYSEVTKKRYYCEITKKVGYKKKEELYHLWEVNFGELEK
jgi:hypothetical protein